MISPLQCKLGRIAVGMSVDGLAKVSGLGPATIRRFEAGSGDRMSSTVTKIEAALASLGVEFIGDFGVNLPHGPPEA